MLNIFSLQILLNRICWEV